MPLRYEVELSVFVCRSQPIQVEVLLADCLGVWKHEPAGSWWSVSVVPMSDQAELPLTRCNITLGSRGQAGNNHGTTRHHTRQILQIASPIKTYVYPASQAENVHGALHIHFDVEILPFFLSNTRIQKTVVVP